MLLRFNNNTMPVLLLWLCVCEQNDIQLPYFTTILQKRRAAHREMMRELALYLIIKAPPRKHITLLAAQLPLLKDKGNCSLVKNNRPSLKRNFSVLSTFIKIMLMAVSIYYSIQRILTSPVFTIHGY